MYEEKYSDSVRYSILSYPVFRLKSVSLSKHIDGKYHGSYGIDFTLTTPYWLRAERVKPFLLPNTFKAANL